MYYHGEAGKKLVWVEDKLVADSDEQENVLEGASWSDHEKL